MSALFSPITIGHVTFPNRVVMPPMVCAAMPTLGASADDDGCVTDDALGHYGRRARAGVGLIIVEATAVDEGGRCWRGGLGAYADRHIEGLARLAERIHAGGAVAAIQLVHGGPQASPVLSGGRTVGPSAVRPSDDAPVPEALTLPEIQAIEQRFEEAAARVVQAGFDAVEVHGAHGYLLDSFLSAQRNRRNDAYGGSLRGRMRALVETCARIKDRVGERALVDCRISIFNKIPEGFTSADLEELVRALEGAGVDLLHVSTESTFEGYFGSRRSIGAWVKSITQVPVIIAGGLVSPSDAERAVAEGHADFAAVGRALLEDPEWAQRARITLEA